MLLVLVLPLIALLLLRIVMVLPKRLLVKGSRLGAAKRLDPCKTLVVIGSGLCRVARIECGMRSIK